MKITINKRICNADGAVVPHVSWINETTFSTSICWGSGHSCQRHMPIADPKCSWCDAQIVQKTTWHAKWNNGSPMRNRHLWIPTETQYFSNIEEIQHL